MDFSQFLENMLNNEPKTHTQSGKPVSHFSMCCYFHSGKKEKFTYRGDQTMKMLKAGGHDVKNELHALIIKYKKIYNQIKSCKIWNNRNNQLEQLIFDQDELGQININKLEIEYKKLVKK